MNNSPHSTFNVQTSRAVRAGCCWLFKVERRVLNVPRSVLIFAIQLYRWTLSPLMTFLFGSTAGCRFTPSCSVYAMDAVRNHGALRGGGLAVRRICRCHPWGECGHDPVPGGGKTLKPAH